MKIPNNYHQLKKKFTKPLDQFENHLKKQEYAVSSIEQFKNYTAYFFNWKEKNGLGQISYNDLLVYIDFCREQDNSTKLINRKLLAVRKYYEHLQSKGEATKNPASGLYLKGKRIRVPNNLLDKKELQQLYENYQAVDLRTARNKIIISLLINQAMTTEELHKLEPGHIKLKTAKIEIPGGNHSNGRILKLKASQIMELQEYIKEIRPKILETIKQKQKRSGRKVKHPDFKSLENQLIISVNGSTNIKPALLHLIKALKKINPKIKNCRQVRQSVISEWLKHDGVRKVQYMAGHRYVSTTERYQSNNLEELQEALKEHHPLKGA